MDGSMGTLIGGIGIEPSILRLSLLLLLNNEIKNLEYFNRKILMYLKIIIL